MPIGTIDAVFLQATAALKAHATNVAAANTNSQLRKWMLAGASWSGNPLDVNGMALAFLRGAVGQSYGMALASELGSVGDAASAKLQSDYLAVQERAFRLRHASPVRCKLMAASRRAGHGDVGLGAFARVESYAQDLIVSGAAGFQPGG